MANRKWQIRLDFRFLIFEFRLPEKTPHPGPLPLVEGNVVCPLREANFEHSTLNFQLRPKKWQMANRKWQIRWGLQFWNADFLLKFQPRMGINLHGFRNLILQKATKETKGRGDFRLGNRLLVAGCRLKVAGFGTGDLGRRGRGSALLHLELLHSRTRTILPLELWGFWSGDDLGEF